MPDYLQSLVFLFQPLLGAWQKGAVPSHPPFSSHSELLTRKNNPNQPASNSSPPPSWASPSLLPWFPGSSIAFLQLSMHFPHSTPRMHWAGWERPLLFLCLEERRECSERTHEWLCLVKLPRCAAMGMTSTRLIYMIECYANKRFTFCPLALLMYPREKLAFGHRARFRNHQKAQGNFKVGDWGQTERP